MVALPAAARESTAQLLAELDMVVEHRADYDAAREKRISDFKKLAALSHDSKQIYAFYGKLFDEYRYYNTDSAFRYAQLKMNIASATADADRLCDSQLNFADIFSLTGMFKESLDILNKISPRNVPDYLRPYYYHLHKNIYGLMADYAVRPADKRRYDAIITEYRDSLLKIKSPSTIEYKVIMSEKLIDEKKFDAALSLLNGAMASIKPDDHNRAFLAYSLAQVYRQKKDTENETRYLAISAISDLQSAVKEYVSLRELALVLYDTGDIDRAYSYLKCSMEDAKDCNARLRTVEISKIFPIIDNAYNEKNEAQKLEILIALISISVLSLILIITIFVIYKQMKKLAVARHNLRSANDELSQLNSTLADSNSRLKDTNEQLSETNIIKEEYIGRYMDQCSTYIEKLELYRKSLYKIVASHNMEKLVEIVKSSRVIDEELKDFYRNFDDTFLRLFPDFVEHFNALLNEGERIYPKAQGELNTELRIYALIRLGITDSVKIAQFLRYSVTTIYNYRTRIRNRAMGERDEFEQKVMLIGRTRQ